MGASKLKHFFIKKSIVIRTFPLIPKIPQRQISLLLRSFETRFYLCNRFVQIENWGSIRLSRGITKLLQHTLEIVDVHVGVGILVTLCV